MLSQLNLGVSSTTMPISRSEEGPPNEAIYAALGRLVYAFAQLESSLFNAIVSVLGDTDASHIVVSGIAFSQLVDRFSVLYSAVDDPLVINGELTAFCSHLTALNEARNRQIHSDWGFWLSGEPARFRKRLHRNNGITVKMETVPPEDIVKLAQEMNDAAETVYRLRGRYLETRPRLGS